MYSQSMFKKNIIIFHLKIIFLKAVKNCIILHGCVSVMHKCHVERNAAHANFQILFLARFYHLSNTYKVYHLAFGLVHYTVNDSLCKCTLRKHAHVVYCNFSRL